MAVYAYTADATDFTTAGLVGELAPSSCEHEEYAGGMSELTMEHPLDDRGKWACLAEGVILKAPTPVRTTPAFDANGIVTSVEKWMVKTTAAKADRVLCYDSNLSRKRALLPAGLEITVTGRDSTVAKVKTAQYGGGFVKLSALDYIEDATISDDPAAIEQAEGAWSVRDQLFRIYKIEKTESLVTVWAKRICYDLTENITMYTASSATAREAVEGVLSGCLRPHNFAVYTNSANTRTGLDYGRWNALQALLDPDEGLAKRYGLEFVRDDFSLYLLTRAGMDRGVRIEYGKNLRGVRCEIDESEVYTRVLPVGTARDGGPLLLEGASPWVESSRASNYATPKMYVLNCSSSCKVTSDVNEATVRTLMQAEAQALLDAGCDKPKVTLEVDLLNLGDTVEYAQYKGLEQLYIFDRVTVRVARLGIDVSLDVTRTVFDCLRLRYTEVELGELRAASTSASGAQLNRFNSLVRKVGADRLGQGETIYQEVVLVKKETNEVGEILRQAGISLSPQGVIVYADDNVNMLQSKLNVQAGQISLVVQGEGTSASIKVGAIVDSINGQTGSFVKIDADTVDLGDYATVTSLSATNAAISNLESGLTTALHLKATTISTPNLWVNGNAATWHNETVVTDISVSMDNFAGYDVVVGVGKTRKTIYYLGRTVSE